jgi:hypothetical protein
MLVESAPERSSLIAYYFEVDGFAKRTFKMEQRKDRKGSSQSAGECA